MYPETETRLPHYKSRTAMSSESCAAARRSDGAGGALRGVASAHAARHRGSAARSGPFHPVPCPRPRPRRRRRRRRPSRRDCWRPGSRPTAAPAAPTAPTTACAAHKFATRVPQCTLAPKWPLPAPVPARSGAWRGSGAQGPSSACRTQSRRPFDSVADRSSAPSPGSCTAARKSPPARASAARACIGAIPVSSPAADPPQAGDGGGRRAGTVHRDARAVDERIAI